MKPAIVTDSNSGITQAQARELGIFVLPMPVIIDGTVYYEDVDLTAHQFFQALDRRQTVTTSQPAPDDVTSLWDRVLASHDQLVYIPMSSGLSSSCAAAAALAEDYEGRVSVVNNHRISETQRSAILDALALAEAGCTGAEIRQELEQSALDSVIYIGVETLEYLRRGGRVTPAAAAIGSVLQIRPVLRIDGERLDAFAKVRGSAACQKRLLSALADSVAAYAAKWDDIDVAAASSCVDPAQNQLWHQTAQDAFPDYPVGYSPLAFSISSHVGPNARGLAVTRRLARTKAELEQRAAGK